MTNTKPIRIGILGTGFGQTHARIFASFPDVEVVGIAGRDAQKTEEIARSLGIQGYSDAHALVRAEDVDAVSVCVPTARHAEYVLAALEHGKHVFCETPVAFSLADAGQMARRARQAGLHLLVALFGRFVSPYRHAYEMVASNELGEIRAVYSNRRTPPVWGGGWDENFILNLMLHDIDYVCWLLGKPLAVTCRGLENPGGGWNHVVILLEYAHALVTLEGCGVMPSSYPFSTGLRIVGDGGAVDLDWHWGGEGPVVAMRHYPQAGEPQSLSVAGYDPYVAECRYFIDCLRGEADPQLLAIETACASLQIALAARDSLERGGERMLT